MKLNRINWKKLGRIIIFIDAANIIYSCKDLGWHIKYKRLKDYFETRARLIKIYFYTARHDDFEGLNKLLAVLAKLGIQVKSRQLKIYKQRDGTQDVKGNVDGELIVDMMRFRKRYDTAILMSGDSDFVHIVDYLRELGKKIIIISSRGHVSKDLIDVADLFLYLDDFKQYWSFEEVK